MIESSRSKGQISKSSNAHDLLKIEQIVMACFSSGELVDQVFGGDKSVIDRS